MGLIMIRFIKLYKNGKQTLKFAGRLFEDHYVDLTTGKIIKDNPDEKKMPRRSTKPKPRTKAKPKSKSKSKAKTTKPKTKARSPKNLVRPREDHNTAHAQMFYEAKYGKKHNVNRATRRAPIESATLYEIGKQKEGLPSIADQKKGYTSQMYIVAVKNNGVKYWKKIGSPK